MTVSRLAGAPRSYWRASRAHRYSLVFALPLLVAYETLAWLLNPAQGAGVRNGADVIVKEAFILVAGRYGSALFMVVVIAASLWLIRRDARACGGPLRLSVFAGMAAEAVVLALLFGVVVGTVTAHLLGPFSRLALLAGPALGTRTQLMVSLGAGLYEELLFRVILVSSLAWLARRVFGWPPWATAAFAAIVGALIFSAFHYIGAYGDRLELGSFVFRAVGGLFFSLLYLLRGFGITAWTHALYDVFLLLL